MKKLIIIFILLPALSFAQKTDEQDLKGNFSLGMRSTWSLFGPDGNSGNGFGGQARLRFGKMVNSEWFADYITTDIEGVGRRIDAHIGWSVMFYPLMKTEGEMSLQPYFLAGHCFDYTKVTPTSFEFEDRTSEAKERWSSAIQMGLGTHYFITNTFDISLSAQYMIHLGNDIQTEIHEHDGIKELHVVEHADHDPSIEGHILLTLSLNIKICDLW